MFGTGLGIQQVLKIYLSIKPGGSPGKTLDLPKRQETIVLGCARGGDSEHCLNELQRQVRAAAISSDTRDGHET